MHILQKTHNRRHSRNSHISSDNLQCVCIRSHNFRLSKNYEPSFQRSYIFYSIYRGLHPYSKTVDYIPEAFHLNSNLLILFHCHFVENANSIFRYDNRILNERHCICILFGFRSLLMDTRVPKLVFVKVLG